MGLFDTIKEPVFYKEGSSSSVQIAVLEELIKTAAPDNIKTLEQEIRNVKSGMIGEQQIAFELRNSHIPMYVLHDLYLEHEGLTAQIDYLVITRHRNYVIECKNLYGNIEITSQGDFIRNIGYNGKFFKERIYSPVTQNERHLSLIKQIRAAEQKNPFKRIFFDRNFAHNFLSVVVLANPKTILNDRYAEKEIKEQVIPADRLVAYIKKSDSETDVEYTEKEMIRQAEFFLKINGQGPDYTQQYQQMKEKITGLEETVKDPETPSEQEKQSCQQIICPKCGAPMVLRTAAKGANAGSSFYGCSRFPRCRGIVNMK